jgi:hypothetical protein
MTSDEEWRDERHVPHETGRDEASRAGVWQSGTGWGQGVPLPESRSGSGPRSSLQVIKIKRLGSPYQRSPKSAVRWMREETREDEGDARIYFVYCVVWGSEEPIYVNFFELILGFVICTLQNVM